MAARNNVWYNCLVTLQYDPSNVRDNFTDPDRDNYVDPNPADWRMEVYICSRLATKAIEYPQGVLTSWEGDGNVTEPQRNKKYFVPAKSMPTNRCIQKRMLRQSRLFITYSLHHAITAETEGQLIMKKMADAACVVSKPFHPNTTCLKSPKSPLASPLSSPLLSSPLRWPLSWARG